MPLRPYGPAGQIANGLVFLANAFTDMIALAGNRILSMLSVAFSLGGLYVPNSSQRKNLDLAALLLGVTGLYCGEPTS